MFAHSRMCVFAINVDASAIRFDASIERMMDFVHVIFSGVGPGWTAR